MLVLLNCNFHTFYSVLRGWDAHFCPCLSLFLIISFFNKLPFIYYVINETGWLGWAKWLCSLLKRFGLLLKYDYKVGGWGPKWSNIDYVIYGSTLSGNKGFEKIDFCNLAAFKVDLLLGNILLGSWLPHYHDLFLHINTFTVLQAW